MGFQSLRDKLLQAGLVNEEQAKKADAELAAEKKAARDRRQGQRGPQGRGPAPQPPRRQQREPTPEELRAREEEAAFRERQRELNQEREENRKRAVEDRRRQEALRALAEKHEIAERGDEPFHYVSRKKKLLRMYLSKDLIAKLERGELAIIDKPLPSEIAQSLVPRGAAEEALRLDPKALRFYNRAEGETYGFQSADEGEGEE